LQPMESKKILFHFRCCWYRFCKSVNAPIQDRFQQRHSKKKILWRKQILNTSRLDWRIRNSIIVGPHTNILLAKATVPHLFRTCAEYKTSNGCISMIILVSPTTLGITRGVSCDAALKLPYFAATAWYPKMLAPDLQNKDLTDMLPKWRILQSNFFLL
jgi:hypothetical protein